MIKTFGKPGRRSRNSRPAVETKNIRPRVLIICEGANTEPGYFKIFKVHPTVRELTIRGEGMNTMSLVKKAEEIEDEEGAFDEVWCVFDRDSFPPDHYDNAISRIESKPRYNAAYSNEAFELWFVLHFVPLTSGITRKDYNDKLSGFLGQKYDKSNKNNREIYQVIQQNGDEQQAIKRAEALLDNYEKQSPEKPHSQRCPCTTVHLLVKQLRDWEREAKP